jgi:hypothetical protein
LKYSDNQNLFNSNSEFRIVIFEFFCRIRQIFWLNTLHIYYTFAMQCFSKKVVTLIYTSYILIFQIHILIFIHIKIFFSKSLEKIYALHLWVGKEYFAYFLMRTADFLFVQKIQTVER